MDTRQLRNYGQDLVAVSYFLPNDYPAHIAKYPDDMGIDWYTSGDDQIYTFASSLEEAMWIVDFIGGKWDKTFSDSTLLLKHRLADRDMEIEINVARGLVCERKQVGTEIKPAIPEREVPIYEWDCPKSLLGKIGD